eukprot:GHVH01011078.1.p1 GENE.GHVH01011078.1~~GHVH01011078.1.p1  ORF type:complete len:435 (+),score=42.30 GHVH01011078.1:140-1444(+)
MRQHKLIAACAPTPRYVTINEEALSFNYVVVGGGRRGLKTAKVLAEKYPDSTILVIESLKKDVLKNGNPSTTRVLPLNVSLRSEQNELVNRTLTEWTANLLKLPIMPREPNIFDCTSSKSVRLFSLDFNHNIKLNSPEDVTKCQEDMAFWANVSSEGISTQVPFDSREALESIEKFHNVFLYDGTDVTMVNYKQQMIGTKKVRFLFKDAVFYCASWKNMVPDLQQCGDAQAVVRFYPPISSTLVDATRALNYLAIERTQLSFDSPFWKSRVGDKEIFYLTAPLAAHSVVRMFTSGNSLEVCYCAEAKVCLRRIGKNIHEEVHAILVSLSSIFDVHFDLDRSTTRSAVDQNCFDRVVVNLLGVRHLSSKSNDQVSKYMAPDMSELNKTMNAFKSERSNLFFLGDPLEEDFVASPDKAVDTFQALAGIQEFGQHVE